MEHRAATSAARRYCHLGRLFRKSQHAPALGRSDAKPRYAADGGAKSVWPADQDRAAGTPVAYGFGGFLDPYRGHARMWHYGETMGFRTYIERFGASASETGRPDQTALSIVVLCNRTDLNPEALAAKVADLYFVKP